MLKKILLNKAAYNHIDEACEQKNGKRAMSDLEKYYEGKDYVERNIASAFSTLNNTFYKGETKAYNFETYVAEHHVVFYSKQATIVETIWTMPARFSI